MMHRFSAAAARLAKALNWQEYAPLVWFEIGEAGATAVG